MRAATLTLAGNQYLADHARAIGAHRVEIVPTVVDTDRFIPAAVPRPADAPFTIGWIGSPASTGYLDRIRPVLADLARAPDTRLILVGATKGWGEDLPADLRPWSEDSEVDHVRAFDVGISPLSEGSVEQGKCGYKTLQYMACGIPVVVSPIGVHLDIVDPGVTGDFAANNGEWLAAIARLRDDEAGRTAMGQAARRYVETHYSLCAWAPRLANLLRSAARQKTARAA